MVTSLTPVEETASARPRAGQEPYAQPRLRGPLEARLQSGWAALLFFVVVSAAFTWPLVTHMADTLPDLGDAADSAKNIGFVAHQLTADPLHLYSAPWVYPLQNSLTLGEIMITEGVLAAPVIWLTDSIPLAFNLLNFASFALSGFAVWLLVRHFTGNTMAGLVAGMVFAFSPWHYSQYWHLGLGAQYWMVFALFFLMLFLEGTRAGAPRPVTARNARNLALFSLFFIAQALAAGYYAYYEVVLVAVYMLYYALVFLVIALIAAVLGFGGIAGASAGIAQILFFLFLALLVVSLVIGLVRRA